MITKINGVDNKKKHENKRKNISRGFYFKGWEKRGNKQSYKKRISKPERPPGRKGVSPEACSIMSNVEGKLKRELIIHDNRCLQYYCFIYFSS